MRRHLVIDEDGPFSHLFELGAVKQRRYSDNAFKLMREAIDAVDMAEVWRAHSPNRKERSWDWCAQPGCRAPKP